jgi:glutamate transport system permease protein
VSGEGALRFADPLGPRGRRRARVATVAAVGVLAGLAYVALSRLADKGQLDPALWKPFFTADGFRFFAIGLGNTLKAASVAMALALVTGVLLAVARLAPVRALSRAVNVWLIFFRGIPLIILVLLFGLGLPGYGIPITTFWALVVALTIYNSAVVAEIVRAGVLSLERGQREAALAVGLTGGQTMRLVILPQAVRRMLPALVSQLVVVLKDTSLGVIITYEELLRRSQLAGSFTGANLQALFIGGTIYVIVNLIFSAAARLLGRSPAAAAGRRRHAAAPGPAAAIEVG